MKLAFCSLVVISFGLLLCVSALCAFLPEPNGDEFGLTHPALRGAHFLSHSCFPTSMLIAGI
jgi:hypothetical protein